MKNLIKILVLLILIIGCGKSELIETIEQIEEINDTILITNTLPTLNQIVIYDNIVLSQSYTEVLEYLSDTNNIYSIDTATSTVIYSRYNDLKGVFYFSGDVLVKYRIYNEYNHSKEYGQYVSDFCDSIRVNYCDYLPEPNFETDTHVEVIGQNFTIEIVGKVDNLEGKEIEVVYFEVE
jgi:hypothetical protein